MSVKILPRKVSLPDAHRSQYGVALALKGKKQLLMRGHPARRQKSRLKSAAPDLGFEVIFKGFRHQIIQDNRPSTCERVPALGYRSYPSPLVPWREGSS